MKKTTLLALSSLIAISFSLQGCNDTQQAVAAGAIIGAAIGVAVSDTDNNPPPRRERRPPEMCHGDYRQECSSYHDRWGNYVRECRSVWDSCARYYEVDTVAVDAGAADAQKWVTESNLAIAQKWQIGFDGAEKISSTIKQLNKGDVNAISAWGLSQNDMMDWSQGRELSKDSVGKVADSLNITWDQADVMVKTISEKARAQMPKARNVDTN